jgi:hypothetical protein
LLKEVKLKDYMKINELEKIKRKIEKGEKKENIIEYINKLIDK